MCIKTEVRSITSNAARVAARAACLEILVAVLGEQRCLLASAAGGVRSPANGAAAGRREDGLASGEAHEE